jgi:predicted ester cyclase
VEDILVDGDKAAVRILICGTHGREWSGVPATHKKVSRPALATMRSRNGKHIEIFEIEDRHRLRRLLLDQ